MTVRNLRPLGNLVMETLPLWIGVVGVFYGPCRQSRYQLFNNTNYTILTTIPLYGSQFVNVVLWTALISKQMSSFFYVLKFFKSDSIHFRSFLSNTIFYLTSPLLTLRLFLNSCFITLNTLKLWGVFLLWSLFKNVEKTNFLWRMTDI